MMRPVRCSSGFGFLVLAIIFGGERLNADEFSTEFVDKFETRTADKSAVLRDLVTALGEIQDVAARAQAIGALSDLFEDPGIRAQIKPVLEAAIARCDQAQLAHIGHVVGHYPDLVDGLLAKTDDPETLDLLRYGIAMSTSDFETARKTCDTIVSQRYRGQVLNRLVYRAPTLDQKLDVLTAYLASRTGSDAWHTYSSFTALRTHAAEDAEKICEFITRSVPTESSIHLYSYLATSARDEDPDAATPYWDAAWTAVEKTTKPYEFVPSLLANDPRKWGREEWLAEFDRFVLPALRDGVTGISSLSELARFDIDLMIDRTRQSCQHQARAYEGILPQVMARAFGGHPDAVLAWLEETDASLAAPVLDQIARYHLPVQEDSPANETRLKRLGDLAVHVEDAKVRRSILSELERRSMLKVQDHGRVLEEARAEQAEEVDFMSVDLLDYRQVAPFWIETAAQKRRLIERHIERFAEASNYQSQLDHAELPNFISKSGLERDVRIELLREMSAIAGRQNNRYMQSKIASAGATIDPSWAIETIWAILPEDRGRSGKQRYFDWTPPPYDAADAIEWLTPQMRKADVEERWAMNVPLTVAFYDFLKRAPDQDQDAIGKALCASLTSRGHFDESYWLADDIKHSEERVLVLVGLLREIVHRDVALNDGD